jgi:hypothetical protein
MVAIVFAIIGLTSGVNAGLIGVGLVFLAVIYIIIFAIIGAIGGAIGSLLNRTPPNATVSE